MARKSGRKTDLAAVKLSREGVKDSACGPDCSSPPEKPKFWRGLIGVLEGWGNGNLAFESMLIDLYLMAILTSVYLVTEQPTEGNLFTIDAESEILAYRAFHYKHDFFLYPMR